MPPQPDVPEGTERIERAFHALRARCGERGVTFMEIDAYSRLTGEGLSPAEVDVVLKMLDAADAEMAAERAAWVGQVQS